MVPDIDIYHYYKKYIEDTNSDIEKFKENHNVAVKMRDSLKQYLLSNITYIANSLGIKLVEYGQKWIYVPTCASNRIRTIIYKSSSIWSSTIYLITINFSIFPFSITIVSCCRTTYSKIIYIKIIIIINIIIIIFLVKVIFLSSCIISNILSISKRYKNFRIIHINIIIIII